jgi:hypothetical protein
MARWIWPALVALTALPGCREAVPEEAVAEEASAKAPASPVKLGVFVVFDQMRGDFPIRWRPLFGEGGFKRLQEQGAWFTDAHCPYAWTSTAPGHASLGTGASPAVHGIIENAWYDRRLDELVSGSDEDRYDRVPSLASDLPKGLFRREDRGAGSPGRMLAPALGEALKKATGGKGRVFAFSLKDRGAILLGGAKVDGCYWFDHRTGTFATSTYYREAPHAWASRFNRERPADRWFGKPWDRLRKDVDYVKHAGPDDVPGEDVGYKQGRTFPHPMTGGLPEPGKDYYGAVLYSPFGNELMFELARRAVEAEKLGQGDSADLLCLSFSANDAVGHAWGPDSQETLDVTLRSDRLLAELFAWLDKTVGKGRFFVVVAGDHGICPLLHVSKQQGKPGGAMRSGWLDRLPEEYLQKTYGSAGNRARYIRGASDLNVYLNHDVIARCGLKVADVAATLAAWFRKQPEVQAAYTADEQRAAKPADKVLRLVQRSFHPERSGDVAVVPKPYYLGGWTGTNHGTPHPYDTHVTLMAMGPGLKPGERKEPASLLLAPAILTRGLGIDPPAKAEALVPDDLFTAKGP